MHRETRVANRESALMRWFANVFIKASIFFQRRALKKSQVRLCKRDDRQEVADDNQTDTETDVRLKRPEHHIPYPHYFK